ncbi:uncharacterized protein BKA55DRAFT_534587 [Fusarium redolens]|uniref:Uncharacterized protein n=1 Tax=Fusarium redolens TaxID=48865 RepID=A0A9P9KSQ4_FUSRE|nr:uncharacterized protein BKA55DRAFT_534587 [Fusarium redolens]KAH7267821.1 hypothetical protein BKA55DRAFT_534587 [Fusarium redolens]
MTTAAIPLSVGESDGPDMVLVLLPSEFYSSWLGQGVYIADTGLAVHAVKVSIGSKDDHLNTWMQLEAQKLYNICITVYVLAVEIGIGCIAASLASLRILYKRVRGQESQGSTGTLNANTLITIGGGRIGDSSSRRPKARVHEPY